jgi:hypothetical protein
MSKKTAIVSVVLVICLILEAFIVFKINKKSFKSKSVNVNLSDLTYKESNDYTDLKVYTIDDFESFLSDYKSGDLPLVYVTEFVFDGVGMYKTYDLDDFIDEGNDMDVDVLSTSVVNINTTGEVILSGDLKGMVLVNTNGISDDINIVLDDVNIDTDSKKIPAIYVYNKDISYTDHKVTISAKEGTKNYIEGGKFKKVSLIGSDELSNYSNKYSGETSEWYSKYTNYYGVYTSDQVNDIVFAKVTASSDDLKDGDPYYFYKGAGAISSDIDLYFEGSGYLEVTSSKEGIEAKGNLVFSGGIGDYVINAYDDCLNTTTKDGDNVRNDMVIDVNSLSAIVDLDADEGDALDSNGTLTINGGTVIALSHPGSDAGLDSSNGTYINGGTVIATGDMYDEIKEDSKQSFIGLSFSDRIVVDDIITLTDSSDNVIFSYKTDRTYSNLVYSSNKLVDGDYSLYKNGIVDGTDINGFYDSVGSFSGGIALGYTGTGMFFGSRGNFTGDRPEMPNGEMPNEEMPNNDDNNFNRPQRSDDTDDKADMKKMSPPDNGFMNSNNFVGFESANKVFSISGISNLFGGIVTYSVE